MGVVCFRACTCTSERLADKASFSFFARQTFGLRIEQLSTTGRACSLARSVRVGILIVAMQHQSLRKRRPTVAGWGLRPLIRRPGKFVATNEERPHHPISPRITLQRHPRQALLADMLIGSWQLSNWTSLRLLFNPHAAWTSELRGPPLQVS